MGSAVQVRRMVALSSVRIGAAAGTALLVVAGMGASLALRVPGVAAHLWMDEGIAVGIAGHPLSELPGLLRLDGSPPLYYVLLHLWMGVAGRSEVAVHRLSVLFATLCVPAAWWCGSRAGGRRAGAVLAVFAACCPFLTSHADEARMYPLVVLLGLLCVGCFAGSFVHGRGAVPFGVTLGLSLYTHNWALFLAVGLALAAALVIAFAPREERRRLLARALVGFGVAGVMYAPWLPTLLFQARHTGAPWATAPAAAALVRAPEAVLGGSAAAVVVVVAAAGGVARRGLGAGLAVASIVPIALAWIVSRSSPAWDARYLGVILAPALTLAALGLARCGRAGIAALAVLVALWAPGGQALAGSDAFQLAAAVRPLVGHGDLVLAMPFAQIPLLAHYLPPGLHYASPLGPARDPQVVDWRDVAQRMSHASIRRVLPPLLDRARAGSTVLLVVPVAWDARSHRTALGRDERSQAARYERALLHDARFRRIATVPAGLPRLPATSMLRGLVLRKVRSR
jgi:mannosyltransferase